MILDRDADHRLQAARLTVLQRDVAAVAAHDVPGDGKTEPRVDAGVLAAGIVQALEANPISIPVIVRLAGTRVEEGRKILAESDVDIITATDLTDAANKVVKAVG